MMCVLGRSSEGFFQRQMIDIYSPRKGYTIGAVYKKLACGGIVYRYTYISIHVITAATFISVALDTRRDSFAGFLFS